MKIIHLVTIALVLVLSSQLSYATTYGGHLGPITIQMPFMKTNSTGTITIKYVVYYPHNDTFGTTFAVYGGKLQDPEPFTLKDLTINAEPKSINLLENNTVTYTIVAKNTIKGVYDIAPIFPCSKYPLVVGLNESEILPLTLFKLSMPTHCGVISSDAPVREIINYDGIILKNVTRTQDQFSPMEQVQLGSNSTDVQCKQGLDLIINTHDNMPACVKQDTATKLVERGWAKMMFSKTGITINSYTPISNETENQTVKIVEIKMVPPYTPGGPVIQLTIQNIGTTPITNLNAILETNHNYTFNFKSITSSTPLISGNSRSDTTMLIGGGFQTESTYSLIISGMKDNVPFEYLEKVRIQG